MAESIFVRVKRVMSASVQDMVDSMEKAGGSSVMREAIREVDNALDEVRAEQDAATARGLQAQRQQKMFEERCQTLEEKAKFAVSEGRDDLAEAALSQQIDFEAQAKRLVEVQETSKEQAARLGELVTDLATRKQEMEKALDIYEQSQRDASIGGDGPTRQSREIERRVERAEKAFDRVMGGIGGVGRTDAKAAAKVAELDTMQKSSTVAQRLAALKGAKAA